MLIKVLLNGYSPNIWGKYRLHYRIGEITKALPYTLGVFCYPDVKSFIDDQPNMRKIMEDERITIVEVEGFGEIRENFRASSFLEDFKLDSFYEGLKNNVFVRGLMYMVNYAVCYPAVKVIRELDKKKLLMGEYNEYKSYFSESF